MRRIVALTSVGLCLVAGARPAYAADQINTWSPPTCGQVTGDGSVTFSWNAGRHLTPTSSQLATGTIVWDLTPLATANHLLSVTLTGQVSRSTDAGCTWSPVAQLDGQPPFSISAAPDGSAYVWSKNNGNRLYRVQGTRVTELPDLQVDYAGMVALVADPHDADHLRALTGRGVVRDSVDGGRTFQSVGSTPTPELSWDVYGYDGAIAASDLDHLVLGTVTDGVFVSDDGGQTWAKSTMAGKSHRINVFTVVVSPVDPSVVWAMGLDITEMDAGSAAQGRHIYRSTDGGRTFQPAVDHVPGKVMLVNGPLLEPDPVDPGKLYFVYGDWFAGYGTDLWCYDATGGGLTLTHNDYDDVGALAFNPRFPMVMYLGLAEER